MSRVVILDANQRSALAATRSLGSKGIDVIAADETTRTLAGCSRYCRARFTYPSPYENPSGFFDTLRDEISARGAEVLFPMTDISTRLSLEHRAELGDVHVALPDLASFDQLSDKYVACEWAKELGIPFPATRLVMSARALPEDLETLTFPLVLKPVRSLYRVGARWAKASVHYAGSPEALAQALQAPYFQAQPFLVQEYIAGQGYGVFMLYDRGLPVASFAHRRLREKPPWGGVSVLSESIALDPGMQHAARMILDRARWHGVAMVEFKRTPAGVAYLMEVNGRFWGSLQLAIDAGVDFPFLLYKLALGESVKSPPAYTEEIRCRWLLGDLDHLYLSLREHVRGRAPRTERLPMRTLAHFFHLFDRKTRYETNRWEDLGPFLFELWRYVLRR